MNFFVSRCSCDSCRSWHPVLSMVHVRASSAVKHCSLNLRGSAGSATRSPPHFCPSTWASVQTSCPVGHSVITSLWRTGTQWRAPWEPCLCPFPPCSTLACLLTAPTSSMCFLPTGSTTGRCDTSSMFSSEVHHRPVICQRRSSLLERHSSTPEATWKACQVLTRALSCTLHFFQISQCQPQQPSPPWHPQT